MTIKKVYPNLTSRFKTLSNIQLSNTINELIDSHNYQSVTEVADPYVLEEEDSGSVIVFDAAGDAVLNIPDDLPIGYKYKALNVGAGSVVSTPANDTIRGLATIADDAGMLSYIKVAATVWQSSEN